VWRGDYYFNITGLEYQLGMSSSPCFECSGMGRRSLLVATLGAVIACGLSIRLEEGENFQTQPEDEWPEEGDEAPSPYILFGPHGYQTFPHSRCQEVPTVSVDMSELQGDWWLQEYINSHDGKPIGPNLPYLCPESRLSISPGSESMNASSISYEWPVTFVDTVEWVQHPEKTGVFFHEENVFSLWTMKIMDFDATKHMVVFLCIDYTIWPGWNHRGVYVYSREAEFKDKVPRKLSDRARRRMKMVFDRRVNTTICDPEEWLPLARPRWHPHKQINPALMRAPVHPYISRSHRRNLKVLD